jgi:DNA helicase-2/ATP-dependent DNA helicase PcrA
MLWVARAHEDLPERGWKAHAAAASRGLMRLTLEDPMVGMNELLSGLNAEQRLAVETVDGPVLIMAGPGSGKTRVLTHRIAYLLQERGAAPWQILAVTFTNKAAKEMRDRLERLVGPVARDLTVGTFHNFCVRILRQHGHYFGLDRSFTIYDSDDQMTVIKRALKELDLDAKQHPPRAILSRISSAKSVRATPDDFRNQVETYNDEIVARVYPIYQRMLREYQALDFDDLLNRTVELFQYVPEVLKRFQERYLHIMVDEYQDTNLVQYSLIHQLAAGPNSNLCVVGDEDQSIYRFRGADITNIRNFQRDYPKATTIFLEQNYRSTQPILEAAMGVIKDNPERTEKQLHAVHGTGTKVQVQELYDERQEAQFLVTEISRLHVMRKHPYRDFAIMYRTNAQSRPHEHDRAGARPGQNPPATDRRHPLPRAPGSQGCDGSPAVGGQPRRHDQPAPGDRQRHAARQGDRAEGA